MVVDGEGPGGEGMKRRRRRQSGERKTRGDKRSGR
jgi:hypothetical protein